MTMLGGLKQARSDFGNIRPARLKAGHLQQKPSLQIDGDNPGGFDGGDEVVAGVAKESAQEEGSAAAVQADDGNPKDGEGGPCNTAGVPMGGEPTAGSNSTAGKADSSERARPRTRVMFEDASGVAPKKQPERQQAQAAGGRGTQRTSTAALQPRTADDIWQLNMQLGQIVGQLADPEDSKQGRRKQNGPTLTENLTKRWGGNYSQLLDKSFAAEEVEEPPPPKYEPPTFLEEVNANDDESLQLRPSLQAGKEAAGPKSNFISPGIIPGAAAVPKGVAAATSTRAGTGRRAAVTSSKKTAACSAATAVGAAAAKGKPVAVDLGPDDAVQGREGADAAQDKPVDVDTINHQRDALTSGRDQQPDEDVKAAPRRGGRKAKAAVAKIATKAARPNPAAARRTGRGAGAAAAVDINSGDQDPRDQMENPPVAAAAAVAVAVPAPSVVTNPGRSKHRSTAAFGSTVSKPPLPLAGAVADSVEDAAVGGADPGTTAVKRGREAVAMDEKQRMSKACRTEQQLARDMEALRSRNADLEVKYKQQADLIKELKEERMTNEKRIANLEMERKRDASELAAANREIEKLKAELKDRDDRIKARDLFKDKLETIVKGWPSK